MAVKKPESTGAIEAFVLCDCTFGKAGEVVTITPADAESGAKNGLLDLHPDAIEAHKK